MNPKKLVRVRDVYIIQYGSGRGMLAKHKYCRGPIVMPMLNATDTISALPLARCVPFRKDI